MGAAGEAVGSLPRVLTGTPSAQGEGWHGDGVGGPSGREGARKSLAKKVSDELTGEQRGCPKARRPRPQTTRAGPPLE